jgi:hypothetical protein
MLRHERHLPGRNVDDDIALGLRRTGVDEPDLEIAEIDRSLIGEDQRGCDDVPRDVSLDLGMGDDGGLAEGLPAGRVIVVMVAVDEVPDRRLGHLTDLLDEARGGLGRLRIGREDGLLGRNEERAVDVVGEEVDVLGELLDAHFRRLRGRGKEPVGPEHGDHGKPPAGWYAARRTPANGESGQIPRSTRYPWSMTLCRIVLDELKNILTSGVSPASYVTWTCSLKLHVLPPPTNLLVVGTFRIARFSQLEQVLTSLTSAIIPGSLYASR